MWVGVTCSRRHTQRVTALNFSSQSLVGSLSPHIGNLSFLRMIDLYSNNFQGQIPQEIGHLFRLERIRLSINSFSGDIPKNLTHCVQLKELHLYDNKLVGNIPFELGSLTKLNRLSLGKNNLVGHIPPWLGNFSSLTKISLLWNSLEGSIPDELGQLRLDFLMVGANKLSGMIPSSIYNLSSLITFGVAPNHLHGTLPPELGLALPNLKELFVGGNYFTGNIPRSLGNASGLVRLDLSYNNFTGNVPTSLGRLSSLNYFGAGSNQLGGMIDEDLGFITSLTNCSDLITLELRNNQFSAMLPFSIANLSTQLQQLWLDQNQIFGTIPSGIENLASLISLGMGANEIIGTIPVHLGRLSKLEKLYLEKNKLSGQLPDSIGNLTRLFELSLGDNNLQGTIPLRLENCQHLQSLGLYNNKLHGPIPKQIFNSRSLILLFLSNNSFVGSLPLEVGTLENLEKLAVNGNKLSGEIPSTLGNCIKLEYLYMGDNFFQGNIPPSLSALKGLKELDLSRNKLHGAIPKYLEQFRFLQYLNLSFNHFEGEVPQQGIFQNTSALSIAGNIKLCGGIPNMHLPTCPKLAFKRERGVLSVKVIIGIVIPVVFLLLLLSYFSMTRCWWKSSKKTISLSFMKKPLLQVTYADLLKATDGFSSINLIGMGSYGSVYKGIIDHIQTTVAIKVLKLQQPKSSKSFITECKALRNVKHRNIVKILTVCSSIDFDGNDFKALVFEYMPNGSLDMWLHPNANENNPIRNLNLIQRIDVAIDVACALDYLHHHCQEPIVHCDIKPSNVLLDDDMVAHVSDFGLARLLSEDEVIRSQTQSSSLLLKGSIGYIAPGVTGPAIPFIYPFTSSVIRRGSKGMWTSFQLVMEGLKGSLVVS